MRYVNVFENGRYADAGSRSEAGYVLLTLEEASFLAAASMQALEEQMAKVQSELDELEKIAKLAEEVMP